MILSKFQTLVLQSLLAQSWPYSAKSVVPLTLWLHRFSFIKVKENLFTLINVTFILWELFCTKWCTINILLITQLKKWKLTKEFIWLKSLESLTFSLIAAFNNKLLKDVTGINLCKFSHFLKWKSLNTSILFSKETKIFLISSIMITKNHKIILSNTKKMFMKRLQKMNQKNKMTKKGKTHSEKSTYPSQKIIWKRLKKKNLCKIIIKKEKLSKIWLKKKWDNRLGKYNMIIILKTEKKSKDNWKMKQFQQSSWCF